jgi:hypothetical protein
MAVGGLLSWKSGLRVVAILLFLPSLVAVAQRSGQKPDKDKDTTVIPGAPQPHKPAVKPARAVAVLEWSADAVAPHKTAVVNATDKSLKPAVPTPTAAIPGAASGDIPKTARLVPVSIFYQGDYQDAGVYMSQPAPLAVMSGTVYALESAGDPAGYFTLHDASRVQDSWLAFGAWSPLHPAAKAAGGDDARPHYNGAKSAAGNSASAAATPPPVAPSNNSGSQQIDDQDRPTLHRHAPAPANNHDGIANTDDVPDPGADPNRPHIRRGKQNDDHNDLAEMLETPKNLRQTVAVSDAAVIDDRSFAHLWGDEKERAQAQSQMQALALKQIAAFQKQQIAAGMKVVTGTKSTATQSARTAHTRTPAKSSTATPTLTQIQFSAYDLAYQDDPTYVFAAQTPDPGPDQLYVAVIARPDIYGELQVAFSAVTKASQLYLTPRYRLVDAVDSNGDGRAELLLEARNEEGRRFVLMQVFRGVATQVFETGLLP